MAPSNHPLPASGGIGRVRARLLTALHMGKLRPGDRVPSVRRLAGLTGMNHKTVHRAYAALAREGVLEVRRGSGTFVTERKSCAVEQPSTDGLMRALARCKFEAHSLGLAPAVLSRFLSICLCDGLRGTPVGMVECNWEQIAIIGRDLHESLGLEPRPILLEALERDPARALGSVHSVVTTDCHWSDVARTLEPYGVPTYTVSLDPEFPQTLLKLARRHRILMVVRDPKFGHVFMRLLTELTKEREVLSRVVIVGENRAAAALRIAPPGTLVYVSPLVTEVRKENLPSHLDDLACSWHVPRAALDRVHAGLALDEALRA